MYSWKWLDRNLTLACTGRGTSFGGLIGRGNRGRTDSALDQMMVKQKISFARAQAFDFAALAALPAIYIEVREG